MKPPRNMTLKFKVCFSLCPKFNQDKVNTFNLTILWEIQNSKENGTGPNKKLFSTSESYHQNSSTLKHFSKLETCYTCVMGWARLLIDWRHCAVLCSFLGLSVSLLLKILIRPKIGKTLVCI